jgi:hypothetical protein
MRVGSGTYASVGLSNFLQRTGIMLLIEGADVIAPPADADSHTDDDTEGGSVRVDRVLMHMAATLGRGHELLKRSKKGRSDQNERPLLGLEEIEGSGIRFNVRMTVDFYVWVPLHRPSNLAALNLCLSDRTHILWPGIVCENPGQVWLNSPKLQGTMTRAICRLLLETQRTVEVVT